jgi:hypothetical protein
MSEVNPPGFLQNAGSVHTAEILRENSNVLTGGGWTSASQHARGGINPALGLAYSVLQNGSPNMSVNVGSGHALVSGTETAKQSIYSCFNDGTVNKTITASDPSLPRIDIVVLKVQDTFYSGVTNAWSIAVVTGVAASSPAVPAAPANSITIGQIAVGAGVTTIVNANITDTRPFLAAVGGITPVKSQTERDALQGNYAGMAVWRQDTTPDRLEIWDGSTWSQLVPTPAVSAVDATSRTTTSTSFTTVLSPAGTCGVAFVAPYSGKVLINHAVELANSGSGFTICAPAVRTGAVVGSGSTTLASTADNGVRCDQSTLIRAGASYLLTGLTSGASYNVTLEQIVGTGTGTFVRRNVIVVPLAA